MKAKKESAVASKIVKQRVKVSKVKVRHVNDARPFMSAPGVRPLRDVCDAKGNCVEGISEEQKIAEGIRQPYLERISFKKTDLEKEELAKHKRSYARVTGWLGSDVRPNGEIGSTLIVHLKNISGAQDFRTTHSFKNVKPSEVNSVISLFFTKLNKDNVAYYPVPVKFYFFKGQKQWLNA